MVTHYGRNWWALAIRGLVAVIFGILALIWPGITLAVLVLFFGAYVLVDGIFAVISALTNRAGHNRWWLLLLEGLAGILAGVLTFLWPGITAFVLLFFIAAWAIVTGILELAAAVRLRKEITGEWMLALSGIASLIFAILIALFPGAGALAVVWLIGAYAIVFGILLIALALRVRSMVPVPGGQAQRPA